MDAQVVRVPGLDSRISLAYRNNMLVADQVFPIVTTDKDAGFYAKYSKQALRSVIDDLDEGGYPRRYSLSQEPYGYYRTKGHGVEVLLRDKVRSNADNPAEIDIQHRDFVQGLIALGREIEVINLINATNITQNTTLSGSSQWSNSASNPLQAIRAQIRTIQKAVPGSTRDRMRLLLPGPVYDQFQDHPTVRDYIKYTQNLLDRPIDAAAIAAALGIEKVVVAENLELTSNEGQTDALSFTWPSAVGSSIALLYYTTGAPAPLTPNFGYVFRSRYGYYPLRQVRDERALGTIMISQEERDTIMTEPNAAFLWNNPI